MAQHQVGKRDATLTKVDKIVGRELPERVVDANVSIFDSKDAAILMWMETSFNRSVVADFLRLVVPVDSRRNGVVGHFRGQQQIVQAIGNRVSLGDICPSNFTNRKRPKRSRRSVEVSEHQIVDIQIANLDGLGASRQVKLSRLGRERTVDRSVFRNLQVGHEQPTQRFGVFQRQAYDEILFHIVLELVFLELLLVFFKNGKMELPIFP